MKGLMGPNEASGSRRCGIFGRARKVEMRRMEFGGRQSKGQRAKGAHECWRDGWEVVRRASAVISTDLRECVAGVLTAPLLLLRL